MILFILILFIISVIHDLSDIPYQIDLMKAQITARKIVISFQKIGMTHP